MEERGEEGGERDDLAEGSYNRRRVLEGGSVVRAGVGGEGRLTRKEQGVRCKEDMEEIK